jgi:hypothetical protein
MSWIPAFVLSLLGIFVGNDVFATDMRVDRCNARSPSGMLRNPFGCASGCYANVQCTGCLSSSGL